MINMHNHSSSLVYNNIKLELKRSWDLSLIILLSLLIAIFSYLIPNNLVLIIIGLPFILLFPGYSLIAALSPEENSMDVIGRIALSFGLSIAIVSLIGFGLNYTSYGIRLEPLLLTLVSFEVLACCTGIWRRNVSNEPFFPFRSKSVYDVIKKGFIGGTNINKALNIVLVISILSSVLALAYVIAIPKNSEHFSEFNVLGPEGGAYGYPTNLTVNQSAEVYIGITNHEYRTVNYTVEVWIANETYINNVTIIHHLLFIDNFSVILDSVPLNFQSNLTPQWQQLYKFNVPISGNCKIWFILLLNGTPFEGVKNQDYSDAISVNRFLSMVNSDDYYSLNLNLNVSE